MASVDSSVLDKRCSDVLFMKISEEIVNWEELAPYFSLTEVEVQTIRVNHAHHYEVQKHVMLWKWASKQEDKVTNRELRSVFQVAGKSLLVSKVDELLQDVAYLQAPLNVVNSFREYLKDCYHCKPATYPGQEDCEPLMLSQSSFLNPNLVFKKVTIMVIQKVWKLTISVSLMTRLWCLRVKQVLVRPLLPDTSVSNGQRVSCFMM